MSWETLGEATDSRPPAPCKLQGGGRRPHSPQVAAQSGKGRQHLCPASPMLHCSRRGHPPRLAPVW